MNINGLKKCIKCGEMKMKREFHNTIANVNKCADCRNIQQREDRAKKKSEDPINYLLETSCQNAYKRGQSNYTETGYEHVDCGWDSAKHMMHDLQSDELFYSKWKLQTEIHLRTNKEYDKPSIDRIDSNKGYVLGNIQCLSLGENKAKGGGKPCIMIVLKNTKFVSVGTYYSIVQAMDEFNKQHGFVIPYKVLRANIDNGQIHDVGHGFSILFQSENGLPAFNEEPKYLMVLDHKKYLINEETNNVVKLLERTQYQIPVSGLWIDKKNSVACDATA